MNIGRYFRVSQGDASERGVRLRSLPTWTKITAILFLIVALVFTGLAALATQKLVNSRMGMLHEMSSMEAFRLKHQITQEIAWLEAFAQTDSVQESLLASQEQAAPGPDEIVLQADPAATEALEALRQAHGQLKSAALVSKSGLVLALSPEPETLLASRSQQWSWLDQTMSTGSAFVAARFSADELTGASGLHIAVPIKRAGASEEILGVLYAVIDPASLAFIAPAGSTLKVATYDQNGVVLIPSIDPVTKSTYNDPIPRVILDQMLKTPSGTAFYRSTVSPEYHRLYGYTAIPDLKIGNDVVGQLGWFVVPQQIGGIVSSTNSLLLIIGIGAGILGIGIALVTFIFSRSLIDLAYAANRIVEQDDLKQPLPSYSGGDVGVLTSSFRRLADRLSHQNEQLKTAVEVSQQSLIPDLDELLNSIVQTMGERVSYRGVGIYIVEPNTQRARVTAAWGALSDGLTKAGDVVIIGKSTLVGRSLMKMELQRDAGTDVAEFAGSKTRYDELVVPFVGKVSGVLQVIGSKPHMFSEGDIDILRLIANQIGFILENRQILADTQIAREEAEKANRVKSQFLANMSHELRTPLNAILNFTGFVMDGDTGPVTDEQIGLLTKVYQSGEHLLNLINDILDLSKIEADMMQFLVEEVDLNQILVSTASVAKGLIKDKNIDFGVQIEEHLPLIQGDKRRLRQVFLNLISNAVKFTREGSVTLEAYGENGGAHICVSDTGVGIASEDRSLVFAAFQQGQHNYEVSGTGLGLAISKHFIEAHGGKIWFDSEVGVGTTFHVTLPTLGMDKKGTSIRPLDG